jgi:amino acid permease
MDKLKIKSEIQEAFNDQTVSLNEKKSILKMSIALYKAMKFLSNEITIFLYSMIPTLAFSIYFFVNTNVNFASYASIFLLLIHFIVYKLVFKMWLLKDSDKINQESSYALEVLREIKKDFK